MNLTDLTNRGMSLDQQTEGKKHSIQLNKLTTNFIKDYV